MNYLNTCGVCQMGLCYCQCGTGYNDLSEVRKKLKEERRKVDSLDKDKEEEEKNE